MMKPLSVVYIISNIDRVNTFDWYMEFLDREKFNISFLLLNPTPDQTDRFSLNLREKFNIECFHVPFRGKGDTLSAFWAVLKHLVKFKADVVHCHLFEASLIGLFAARLLAVPNRIYTRHHSDLHHKFFKKGLKYDKIINAMATQIIAISKTVETILLDWEKADPKKVKLIYSGHHLERFLNSNPEDIAYARKRCGADGRFPVIGVISRYVDWKGVQYIVPAFKKLLNDYPNALLVLLNAIGPYKPQIQELTRELPKKSYIEIEKFEQNICAMYPIFDAFVHVPVDLYVDAAAAVYIESQAAGVPSVVTLSGVANEFIRDGENALVVDYKNSDQIYKALLRILKDSDLSKKLSSNGEKTVRELFGIQTYCAGLARLYEG